MSAGPPARVVDQWDAKAASMGLGADPAANAVSRRNRRPRPSGLTLHRADGGRSGTGADCAQRGIPNASRSGHPGWVVAARLRPRCEISRGVMARLPEGTQGTPGAAREIAPDVHCLGPHGRTQTNVYFVRSGSSWVLIDAGWAKDGSWIKRAAESVFGADTPAASILLTHVHPDHAGAALELARTWECPVYMHPDELPIANGDFAAMAKFAGPLDHWVVLPMMRAVGRRRREAILARSSLRDVAHPFEPGAGVPGLPGWECIPTPGHTPGHVSFLRASDGVLITGDAVVTLKVNSLAGLLLQQQGLSGPPRYTSWSWRAARESVAKLARLEPVVLAGGHGIPLAGAAAAETLSAFAAQFAGDVAKPDRSRS